MLKRLVRPLLPRRLVEYRNRLLSARLDAKFASQSPTAVFETIYKKRLWGTNGSTDFYSGPGSHDAHVVQPYVEAVAGFIGTLADKPDAVDIGCGDFNIGSQIRPLCRSYVGCDIVPDLIERNRRVFADRNTEFKVIDAANDPLPSGDIIFVRQVLQHMSNFQIQAVLRKLPAFEWAVITEHVPDTKTFLPNVDKSSGPTTRLQFNSGVLVEEAPFSMSFVRRLPLCEINYSPGRIATVAYQLRT